MATGNMLLGLSRKKLGDVVFYRSDGQQRARVRVRTIKNPRSAKQAVQRMVLSAASKTLASLRGLYNHSFESVAVGSASLRYAQRLLMEGYRGKAAANINGDAGIEGNQAYFPLMGAPIAGCYNGMPLTRGRLPFNEVTAARQSVGGENVEGLQISGTTGANITTQAEYAAELATLGIEPGDQLTVICYGVSGSTIVAEFGNVQNYADVYRYARVTFKAELPENFAGLLINNGAFNSALIESAEGVMPAISDLDGSLFFSFGNVLPAGYTFTAGTIVRSKKNEAGVTYYSNASFVTLTEAWDENNASEAYPSYMDGADAVNVGDTLYLKNAEASPFSGGSPAPASPFTILPSLPFTSTGAGSIVVSRNDGTSWTDNAIEALVLTLNGTDTPANAGSTISWGNNSITASRGQTGVNLVLTLNSQSTDIVISAIK